MNSNDDNFFLSASDLYNLNNEVTVGKAMIRDAQLLSSAARRPFLIVFGEEQFPTVIDKAAALLHSLAYHHLFIDGNKRTAVRAVEIFLERSGYRVTWDMGEQYNFVLEVAQGQHDVEAVAAWLAQRVEPAN